ncbi:MAG: YciI family protein [Bacteroidia bacterium]
MKQILVLSLIVFGFQSIKAQANKIQYDSLLAKKLGADDYGMKSYVMVLLKTGTYKTKTKGESDSLFRGHMDNIIKLANEGKLALAGPFGKNDLYRGVFIFNVKTIEEAKELTAKDPAIKINLFAVDYLPWYGSAAVTEINTIHKTLEKKSH